MKEWNNPYNSFNSMKVLMWRQELEAIARQDFMPPVTVDTDPTNRCNYDCVFCNAFDYMQGRNQTLSESHLLKLADFYKEWGAHSTCIAGGGEPLLNPGLPAMLLRLYEHKIEPGVITNGSLLNDENIEILARTCRWIGISVDAASPSVYSQLKGINDDKFFNKVMENIAKLTKAVRRYPASNCEVAYKFLIHPLNAHEIHNAAKLAKSMGVNHFHARPVGWDNLTKTKDKKPPNFAPLIKGIEKQCRAAMKLEDASFQFFGVRHKFNPDMTRKVKFNRCWALPLLPTFGADGKVHLCFDMRGREDLILCNHSPDPREILEHWNTERHKSILKSIDPNNCPRCTFGTYNEIVEQVIMKDGMCKYFP